MRAVIVDDEKNNIRNLQMLLAKHCPEVNVVATAASSAEGVKAIMQEQPDVVFLDIRMPGETGFDMLSEIPDRNFELIFVTAFDEYGIQAIKFSALDYLLKPVKAEELKAAVQKAELRAGEKKRNQRLDNLLDLVAHSKDAAYHRLALPSQKETRFIAPADIIRLESSNNYTNFFLKGGEKILVARPLYEYEELLSPYGFIRCHQSHLVNRLYLKSLIKQDNGYLLLEDGSRIPVSKTRKDELRAKLNS